MSIDKPRRSRVAEYAAKPPTTMVTETMLTAVSCRKPKKTEFVRVHTDLVAAVYLLEYEEEGSQQLYFVENDEMTVAACLRDADGLIKPCRIVPTINREGNLYLWPLKVPLGSGQGDTWHKSALRCAEIAQERWTRVASNRNTSSYEAHTAAADIPDPDWGEVDLDDLIDVAFEGRFIDSPSHPVLMKLRGEL